MCLLRVISMRIRWIQYIQLWPKYPPNSGKHIWPGTHPPTGIIWHQPQTSMHFSGGKSSKKDSLRIKLDHPTKQNLGGGIWWSLAIWSPKATATKWTGYVSSWKMYVMTFLDQLPCPATKKLMPLLHSKMPKPSCDPTAVVPIPRKSHIQKYGKWLCPNYFFNVCSFLWTSSVFQYSHVYLLLLSWVYCIILGGCFVKLDHIPKKR